MFLEVVILTRSTKNRGLCVAGIDIRTHEWIRLVSDDQTTGGALQWSDIRYQDGTYCNVFDLVRLKVVSRKPSLYQPENVLIDSAVYWEKIGQYTINDVLLLHSPELKDFLFYNREPYVRESDFPEDPYSLSIIEVESIELYIIDNGFKKKTKASFIYNGIWYKDIAVTDSRFFTIDESLSYKRAYLIVSLPDKPFPEDKFYKFIAYIIPV